MEHFFLHAKVVEKASRQSVTVSAKNKLSFAFLVGNCFSPSPISRDSRKPESFFDIKIASSVPPNYWQSFFLASVDDADLVVVVVFPTIPFLVARQKSG